MKRKHLILLLIHLPIIICAQEWASTGTKWYYKYSSWGFPIHFSYDLFESLNDSVIEGQKCKNISNQFMYFENNKVYWYNDSLNKFHVLYNFSADSGDTWTVVPDLYPADSFQVHVDSIGEIQINETILKVQYISKSYENNPWIFGGQGGEIISGIGSVGYLIPQYGLVDPLAFGLRCYEDKTIGLYKRDTLPCDTSFYWIPNKVNNLKNEGINIYPCPAQDFVFVTGIKDICKIEIYSLIGNLLYTVQHVKSDKVQLENLPNGIYQMAIYNTSGVKIIKRIIKNK